MCYPKFASYKSILNQTTLFVHPKICDDILSLVEVDSILIHMSIDLKLISNTKTANNYIFAVLSYNKIILWVCWSVLVNRNIVCLLFFSIFRKQFHELHNEKSFYLNFSLNAIIIVLQILTSFVYVHSKIYRVAYKSRCALSSAIIYYLLAKLHYPSVENYNYTFLNGSSSWSYWAGKCLPFHIKV